MINYLDLQDTKLELPISVILEPIVENGVPHCRVCVNGVEKFSDNLQNICEINHNIDLLEPITVKIEMKNKIYSSEKETAVKIKSFTCDGIELIDLTKDPISYIKDSIHVDNNYTGFYLGFNGAWKFKINRPFYQWYHVASGQGWLLEPR